MKVFGPGLRTLGIIDHIKKELLKVEEEPMCLEEWLDIIILATDGALRAGYEPKNILSGLINKLNKNKNRKWPDFKNFSQNDAITHIK